MLEHRRRILADLRSTLDDQDRSLLLLRLDHELTWEEVSQVMAWEGRAAEPATLMKRYQRLKTKLGRLARQRGLLDDVP